MSDRGFDVGYGDRDGFLTGKAAAMADSAHRREERQFKKLVEVLRHAKWRKANPEHARKIRREHARTPAAKAKAIALRHKYRARRIRTWQPDTKPIQCRQCGARFCRVTRRGRKPGPRPDFCSKSHSNAFLYARKKEARDKARALAEAEAVRAYYAAAKARRGGQPADLTGQRYGRLVAIASAWKEGQRGTRPWLVRCDCGAEFVTSVNRLRGGEIKSCGCLRGKPRKS
jgi:hypothetical protein